MIEYSNNGYLERPFIDKLRNANPDLQGNAFRFWALDFMIRNVHKSELTLDILCGKNQVGDYLYNRGYNICGIDGAVSNFTRAYNRGEEDIEYKNFPVRLAKLPPIPFNDNKFDCVTLIDVWRWLHPDQMKAGVDYSKYDKYDASICQKQYIKILKEVCRVARKRVVIVERIHLYPQMFNCDFLDVFCTLAENGFLTNDKFVHPHPFPSQVKKFLVIDRIKKKEYGSQRTSYYGVGIVVSREKDK